VKKRDLNAQKEIRLNLGNASNKICLTDDTRLNFFKILTPGEERCK
jgi:hypothetical protein